MKITNSNDFQDLVMRTANSDLGHQGAVLNSALGIAGEAGEYVDLMKKAIYHGHALDVEKALLEIGDILYYCAWAAKLHGAELSTVMGMVIQKLQKRYPEGFSSEASINRPGKEL